MTVRKIGGIAFATGFAVPWFLMGLGWCLDALGIGPGGWLSKTFVALWPASFGLFDAPEGWHGYVWLLISVVINGLLYAFVAVLIAYYIKLIKNRGYDFRDD